MVLNCQSSIKSSIDTEGDNVLKSEHVTPVLFPLSLHKAEGGDVS